MTHVLQKRLTREMASRAPDHVLRMIGHDMLAQIRRHAEKLKTKKTDDTGVIVVVVREDPTFHGQVLVETFGAFTSDLTPETVVARRIREVVSP